MPKLISFGMQNCPLRRGGGVQIDPVRLAARSPITTHSAIASADDGREADGEMVRGAYTLHAEDDDFTQPGALVREVFGDKERWSARSRAACSAACVSGCSAARLNTGRGSMPVWASGSRIRSAPVWRPRLRRGWGCRRYRQRLMTGGRRVSPSLAATGRRPVDGGSRGQKPGGSPPS